MSAAKAAAALLAALTERVRRAAESGRAFGTIYSCRADDGAASEPQRAISLLRSEAERLSSELDAERAMFGEAIRQLATSEAELSATRAKLAAVRPHVPAGIWAALVDEESAPVSVDAARATRKESAS